MMSQALSSGRAPHRRDPAAGIGAATGDRPKDWHFAPNVNAPRRFPTLVALRFERSHREPTVSSILGGDLRRVSGNVWSRATDAPDLRPVRLRGTV